MNVLHTKWSRSEAALGLVHTQSLEGEVDFGGGVHKSACASPLDAGMCWSTQQAY